MLHVDWSADGQYLQTCDARCEYSFWEAASGERVLHGGKLCDVAWATWTCPLGLPVQGIYPKMSDGSDINAGALVRGHDVSMPVHGVCAHPSRKEYATAGDDGSVRVWDIETHKCLRMCYLKGAGIRCVTYSPDGTKLCVGTGTPDQTTRLDGTFRVINEQTMQVMYESKDAEAWVTDVLWSPEGDTLAVASADGNIYLYNNDDSDSNLSDDYNPVCRRRSLEWIWCSRWKWLR